MPSLTVNLSENLMSILKRRARKNLLTPSELVEDVVRRSMMSYKTYGKVVSGRDIDDKLVNIFSRQRNKRKKY